MFGFLIKKSFCDGWDNLLSVILTNVIFLFLGIGIVFLNAFAYLSESQLFMILAFIIAFILISIVALAYGESAAKIANFEGIRYADFFKAIPSVFKDALFLGLLTSAVLIISTFSIRYYWSLHTMLGSCLAIFIFWIDIFYILSIQWFVPLRSLLKNNFKKCLKKCFIIFFDNTGFSVFMGIYDLVLIAFSVLFIGFFPSIAGIIIANTNALRLRLYKYDYLEEHPELKTKKERRQIPWEELIYEDRETLGPRKLKSFIFPWKDQEN